MFLYVSDRPSDAIPTVKALFEQGFYLLYGALDTACFLCEQKETGGVILDCVTDLKKGERICATLRGQYPEMPIAVLLPTTAHPALMADLIVRDSTEPSTRIALLSDFLQHICGADQTRLSTRALTLDRNEETAYYMGYPLSLTKKEHRILYCLFYRAPHLTTPEDLLALCYPGETRSISNVHVHIHHINQKAAAIHSAPLILRTKEGYRLRDGIV